MVSTMTSLAGAAPMRDMNYMARALFLAERGRGRTSPNPLVGAVILSRDGVVVGDGSPERGGGGASEPGLLHVDARAAAFCRVDGGHEPRRKNRERPRQADRTDVNRGQPARARGTG